MVHCMWVRDAFDDSYTLYKGDNLEEGVRRLWAAEWIEAHNGLQYDIPVLERITGIKKPASCKVNDTLIRSRVLWPESYMSPMKGNDLEAWGKFLRCHKGDFKGPWDKWSQTMEDYCKQDVVVLSAISEWLANRPQNEMVVRIEHKVTEIIARQTAAGWTIDLDLCRKTIQELEVERAGIMDDLAKTFPPKIEVMKTPAYWEAIAPQGHVVDRQESKGLLEKTLKRFPPKDRRLLTLKPGPMRTKEHPFNPDSPDQIAERLKEKYGWKPTEMTEGGKPKTDYDVLVQLTYPEVKVLIQHAENGKLLEALIDYDKRATFSRDGKLHGSVNPQGCVTGRMSHKQPNTGNVPKPTKGKDGKYVGHSWKVRACFKPRPGWKLVGIDASGLEARMMAHYTIPYDQGAYAKLLLEGDLHTVNMKVLQSAVPEIDRDGAKTFYYAFIFGAQGEKLGKIVKKGKKVGDLLRATFLTKTPVLAKLIAWCVSQVEQHGQVALLDTRVVPFRSKHAALNTLLQGGGACVMKVALIVLDAELQRRGYKPGEDYEFLGNIHDEWQIECRPEIAEEIGKAGVEAIRESGRRLKVRVPLDGEYKVGNSWLETH